jgi:hypothetical protein
MKLIPLLPLSIVLVTSGCLLGPGDGPPPPDDCSSPRALDGIETIEVGVLQNDVFVPWQEGQDVELTYGSQGGAMLGVVLSLRGSDLPACMPHTMKLRGPSGSRLAGTEYPVRTYPVSDDTRATATIWMIFEGMDPEPGNQLELVLQVGGLEVRRALQIEPWQVAIELEPTAQ